MFESNLMLLSVTVLCIMQLPIPELYEYVVIFHLVYETYPKYYVDVGLTDEIKQ